MRRFSTLTDFGRGAGDLIAYSTPVNPLAFFHNMCYG